MKKVFIGIFCAIVTICTIFLSFGYRNSSEPNTYYKVYLNSEELGTIKSKKELQDYINKKSSEYKKLYNVENVYAPNGLEIKKINTYESKTVGVEEIYNKIAATEPFTIAGYQFSIKKEDSIQKIYVLDKEVFKESVDSIIETFIGKDTYASYKEKTQAQIQTTGSLIESVYVEDNITVKNYNIPVTETIYTDVATLSKYLLFGTVENQSTYVVKIGDTIEDVAFNNKISVEEFLISNPTFTSEKNLLFPGQEVVIGITNPQISVVYEEYNVSDVVSNYKTEVRYDSEKLIGDDEVIQVGENGLERVSQRIKYVNGGIYSVEPLAKEQLKPTVNEIIVKGEKYVVSIGSTSNWLWPTNSGYTITSDYAYRINPINGVRELHAAIDIAGTGYGSPIYAVTNGVVSESRYRTQDGNYVCINHNNGYYTCYAHMHKQNVVEGQVVERGAVIGYMGKSGWATGTHLHFEVWVGGAPWRGGTRINPWKMYNR